MFTVEEWKRRIVKFFVLRTHPDFSYKIANEAELYKQFASNFEKNTQTACEELLSSKIIEDVKANGKVFYTLNFFEKSSEIESIIKNEPFGEKSDLIKPTDKEFKGLKEEFRDANSRGRSNRGFYYFCTKIEDPTYWVVLIKTKPNAAPYKIILGSVTDKNSRMMKIWRATLKVSKVNKSEPFIRKWVENIEQKACGNNRLPSKSAFQIFVHLKWLEITGRKGNVVYYKVIQKNELH